MHSCCPVLGRNFWFFGLQIFFLEHLFDLSFSLGRNGETIRALQRQSRCKIDVARDEEGTIDGKKKVFFDKIDLYGTWHTLKR